MWKYISSSECSKWLNQFIVLVSAIMVYSALYRKIYDIVVFGLWVMMVNTVEYINKRDREERKLRVMKGEREI